MADADAETLKADFYVKVMKLLTVSFACVLMKRTIQSYVFEREIQTPSFSHMILGKI